MLCMQQRMRECNTLRCDELDEESLTGQDAVITELERSSFIEPLRKGNDKGHVEYAAPHLVNSMGSRYQRSETNAMAARLIQ